MKDLNTAIAAYRFGYGLPAGEGFATPSALMAQLRGAVPVPASLGGMHSGDRIVRDAEYVARIARFRGSAEELEILKKERRRLGGAASQAETHARVIAAVESAAPFFDRLVAFWSNHFTVSGPSGRVLGGRLEVEAIRPNVMGRFEELLIAVEHHPAMIGYLNLNQSIGPNSPIGKRRGAGLNENLAREILELHTLGVDGGYSQDDIVGFAKSMTGWMVNRKKGEAEFQRARAEPGKHMLLGQDVGADVPRQDTYRQALSRLARHPATARFIAGKLVTHFIGPGAPEAAVGSVAAAFTASGGDLPPVYGALVRLPEAWSRLGAKARTDFEFIVAALRATGLPAEELAPRNVEGALRPNPLSAGALIQLAQPMWSAPSPAGWPEAPEEWLSPAGLAQRLRWIARIVRKIPDPTAAAFGDKVLGPLASDKTRSVIVAASNREEGLALVLASPEFNRR